MAKRSLPTDDIPSEADHRDKKTPVSALPEVAELLKADPRAALSPPCVYYAVDIETTGPSKATNYMIQLGAVAFVVTDGKPLPVGAFSAALSPPSASHCFDSKCMADFWCFRTEHMDQLKAAALPPAIVMDKFVEWLDAFHATRYVQLSDFTQYDSSWIDHYTTFHSSIRGPLYNRQPRLSPAICTDDTYRVLLKDFASPWVSTSAACSAAGVEYFDPGHEHDAVYDAYGIGVNFLRIAIAEGWKL